MTELPETIEQPYPTPGSIWRHHQGGLYRVICVARREADDHMMVVYQSLEGGWAWARDLGRWQALITPKDGERVPRFTLVEDEQVEDSNPAGRPVEERGPEY